jgi:AcrR family transcriptional regulator
MTRNATPSAISQPPPTTAARIAAAARTLLDKEGAEAISMRRVAEAVGITPMAIYRHFPDREGLLNAIADHGFQSLAEELKGRLFSGDIEQQLTEMGEIYLDHALTNPRLFELMFLKPRQGARQYPRDFVSRKSPPANLMFDLIQQGMADGYFRPASQDDIWEIVFETGALSHGLIMLYLGGRMDLSATEFRQLYRRSFRRYIHGLRT